MLSQIDFLELGKALGIPAAVLAFIFVIVWKYFTTMLPTWHDKAEADVKLTQSLTTELPKIAKSCDETMKVCKEAIQAVQKSHEDRQ